MEYATPKSSLVPLTPTLTIEILTHGDVGRGDCCGVGGMRGHRHGDDVTVGVGS